MSNAINLTDSSMISVYPLDEALPNMETDPPIFLRDKNPSSKVSSSDAKNKKKISSNNQT
jgi:hypothetical protein